MTKRWKRIICTALSLMMTGSLAAEGLVRKQAVGEAPSAAVSFGSAACMSAGTRPPVPADVAKIYADVTVEKL